MKKKSILIVLKFYLSNQSQTRRAWTSEDRIWFIENLSKKESSVLEEFLNILSGILKFYL